MIRRRWTSLEKQAIEELFINHINQRKGPSDTNVREALRDPRLADRSFDAVRIHIFEYIRNLRQNDDRETNKNHLPQVSQRKQPSKKCK